MVAEQLIHNARHLFFVLSHNFQNPGISRSQLCSSIQESAASKAGLTKPTTESTKQRLSRARSVTGLLRQAALEPRHPPLVSVIEISTNQLVLARILPIERNLADRRPINDPVNTRRSDSFAIKKIMGSYQDSLMWRQCGKRLFFRVHVDIVDRSFYTPT